MVRLTGRVLQRSLAMGMRLIFDADWLDAPCSPRFLDFRLFTHAFQSIQKQIVEDDITSKYPEEYSTVDKVGIENPLARKWFLIISCGDYSSEMRKNTLSYPVKADNETTTFRAFIGVLHVILTPNWKIRLFPSWKSFWSPNLFWYLDSQTLQVSSSWLAWVQNGRSV